MEKWESGRGSCQCRRTTTLEAPNLPMLLTNNTGNLASYCKLSDNYTGDLLRTCKNLRELAEDLREQMSQCCCPTTLEARDLPMLSTDNTGSARPANVIDQRHW